MASNCEKILERFENEITKLPDYIRNLEMKRITGQPGNGDNFEIADYGYLKRDLLLMFDIFMMEHIACVHDMNGEFQDFAGYSYDNSNAGNKTEVASSESSMVLSYSFSTALRQLAIELRTWLESLKGSLEAGQHSRQESSGPAKLQSVQRSFTPSKESKSLRYDRKQAPKRSIGSDYYVYLGSLGYEQSKFGLIKVIDTFLGNCFYAYEYRPIGSVNTELTPSNVLYTIARKLKISVSQDVLRNVLDGKDGNEYLFDINDAARRTDIFLHQSGNILRAEKDKTFVYSRSEYNNPSYYQIITGGRSEYDTTSAAFAYLLPFPVEISDILRLTFNETGYTAMTQYHLSHDYLLSYVIHPLVFPALQRNKDQATESQIAMIENKYREILADVALRRKELGLITVSQCIDYFEEKVNRTCLVIGNDTSIPIFNLNYIDTRNNIID
jgi:hypothetical protein